MMNDNKDNTTGGGTNTTDTAELLATYLLPTAVSVPPLGLPTNAWVIRLLLGKPGICSTSEIFILNLAVFDFLFCIMFTAEYINFLFVKKMCASVFSAWSLNQIGGPMLLCLLGLDSYLAVCRPLLFVRLKDPKLRLSLCLVVSAVTLSFCGLMQVLPKHRWTMIICVLICVIVIIPTFNIQILRSLRQSGPNKKVHPIKRRAFKIVLVAFVLINVHYVPPLIEYALKKGLPAVFSPFSKLSIVCYLAQSMSSFVQPLWYLIRSKQLPKVTCCCGSAAETPSSTNQTVATTELPDLPAERRDL